VVLRERGRVFCRPFSRLHFVFQAIFSSAPYLARSSHYCSRWCLLFRVAEEEDAGKGVPVSASAFEIRWLDITLIARPPRHAPLLPTRYPEKESHVGTREFSDGRSAYEWRITRLWARCDGSVPHLSILSAHGHVADDDRLLRSEVVAATRMMMVWLKAEATKGNCVCPVSPSWSFHGAERILLYPPLPFTHSAFFLPPAFSRLPSQTTSNHPFSLFYNIILRSLILAPRRRMLCPPYEL
jgi:hypothetical protein